MCYHNHNSSRTSKPPQSPSQLSQRSRKPHCQPQKISSDENFDSSSNKLNFNLLTSMAKSRVPIPVPHSHSHFITKCTNCVLVMDSQKCLNCSSQISRQSRNNFVQSSRRHQTNGNNNCTTSISKENETNKIISQNCSHFNSKNCSSSPSSPWSTSINIITSLNHRLNNCPCQGSKQTLNHSQSSPSSSSSSHRNLKSYHSFSSSDSGWRPFLHLLFGLLLLPNIMSSPVRMPGSSSSSTDTGEHLRHQRPAKWINPCRMPNHPGGHGHSAHAHGDFEIQQQSDADIFQNIVIQVIKAEHQAKEFMGAYFKESFGINPQYEQDKYKDLHYDFLENVAETVGKYLGEDVDPEKLAELNVEDTLLAMYEGLQKFAVGLEQVVLDQAVYGGSFHQNFHEAEFQLKYVLCELQIALMEKNIVHQDITREIMSQKHRDLENKTTRDIRDWLIFRDYVNTLEYMRHTFKFFLSKTNKDQ